MLAVKTKKLLKSIKNHEDGELALVEKTKKVFFSKGNIGFLRICDVWINWIIYGYGMDDYLLSKSKIDSIGISPRRTFSRPNSWTC